MGKKWNNCFMNIRQLIEKNKLDDISYNKFTTYYKAIRFHNKNETFAHFMIKCAVAKILFNKRMAVSAEFPLIRRGMEIRTFDVLDLLEMNAYEIESMRRSRRKQQYTNKITIYTDEIPVEVMDAFATLRRWLDAKVVLWVKITVISKDGLCSSLPLKESFRNCESFRR